MKMEHLNIGQRVTWYPRKRDKLDNRHFPAVVVDVHKETKNVLIKYFSSEFPDGSKPIYCKAHSLDDRQIEIQA